MKSVIVHDDGAVYNTHSNYDSAGVIIRHLWWLVEELVTYYVVIYSYDWLFNNMWLYPFTRYLMSMPLPPPIRRVLRRNLFSYSQGCFSYSIYLVCNEKDTVTVLAGVIIRHLVG